MPRIWYIWGRARTLVRNIYGCLRNAIQRVINRARRRRLFRHAQRDEPAEQPSRRRVHSRPTFDILEKGEIKRCICRIQANDISVTSIRKLLKKVKGDLNIRGTTASLRRLLKDLGLVPIVVANRKEYFLERKKTRLMRSKYLQKITKYRSEGRPIVYTALSSVNLPKMINLSDDRAVIAYAASESGLIPNSLTVYKYNMPIEQWYYMIRYETYEDWIRTYLMPNLPPKSVVVMRNTPWNKTMVKKTAMESWLREKCIPFETPVTKSKLRKLINLNEGKHEQKIIDDMLKANKHTVLRLPSFHDDLNPLEVIWLHVQEYLKQTNTYTDLNNFVRLTYDKLALIDAEQMSEYCQGTTLIESTYRICGMHAETLSRRIVLEKCIASAKPLTLNVDLEERDDIQSDLDSDKPDSSRMDLEERDDMQSDSDPAKASTSKMDLEERDDMQSDSDPAKASTSKMDLEGRDDMQSDFDSNKPDSSKIDLEERDDMQSDSDPAKASASKMDLEGRDDMQSDFDSTNLQSSKMVLEERDDMQSDSYPAKASASKMDLEGRDDMQSDFDSTNLQSSKMVLEERDDMQSDSDPAKASTSKMDLEGRDIMQSDSNDELEYSNTITGN